METGSAYAGESEASTTRRGSPPEDLEEGREEGRGEYMRGRLYTRGRADHAAIGDPTPEPGAVGLPGGFVGQEQGGIGGEGPGSAERSTSGRWGATLRTMRLQPLLIPCLVLILASACGDPASSKGPEEQQREEGGAETGLHPDSAEGQGDSGIGGDSGAPCAGFELRRVSPEVADQGDPGESGSVAAWIAALPPDCATTLVFEEAGAYAVLSDLSVPSTVGLRFVTGAWLELGPEVELSLMGAIDAGRARIFGDAGRLSGEPQVEALYPEWFGALPDDGVEDQVGLQRALDLLPRLSFDAGVYRIGSTLRLPSGSRLAGPEGPEEEGDVAPAVLQSALVYPTTEGFYPTRMLEASDATDLQLRDLVLDGDRHSRLVECWNYPEADNLGRFERVDGLLLERVQVTGYEGNWGSEDQTLARAVAVLSSQSVTFTDVRFTDSRTEGILFQDCEDVVVQGFFSQNTDVWTPLHAFYVDGFTLVDSTIIEDEGVEWSGSTANLTVKRGVVTGNSFQGGWGLDFGDEVGTTPFGPGDIVIEDNVIETLGHGIYFSPYAPGDSVTGVEIRNNELRVSRQSSADSTDELLRFDASADVLVEDNLFVVSGGGDSFSRGISFQGSTDNITLQRNEMEGVDVGISHSGDSASGGSLLISGNQLHCATSIRRDTWSGGSTGVWIFRYRDAHFDRITVEDNLIEAVGGWVSLIDYASLSSDPGPFVDELILQGNAFNPAEGPERSPTWDGASTVTISGNTPAWVNP